MQKYFMLTLLTIPVLLIGLFFFTKNQTSNYNFILKNDDIEKQRKETELKVLALIDVIKSEASTTFDATFKKLDELYYNASQFSARLSLATFVSKDKEVRENSKKTSTEFSTWLETLLFLDPAIYLKLKTTYETEKHTLNPIEKKLADDILLGYKISGAELSSELKEKLHEIGQKIKKSCIAFSTNIYDDIKKITLTEKETKGLTDFFKEGLQRDEDGNYIITFDAPTYTTCMQYLESSEIRKKIYTIKNNIAYPANVSVLEDIRKLRYEYAKILGFNSFAELDFAKKMSKNYQTVEAFCHNLLDVTKSQALQEKKDLFLKKPDNIYFNTEKNNFNPYDVYFLNRCIKQKYFDIDNEEVSKYFPVEETTDALIDIYSHFFSIRFEKTTENLWEDNLYVLKAYDKEDNFLGTIILDLYPRDNKYNHACNLTVTYNIKNSYQKPFITTIIANFPKPTPTKPALLNFRDVETFFHEFGHAMHALLGKTTFYTHSGTNVYLDFVETPSQMFEEWLNDASILQKVSCHYQTKEPLPLNLIESLQKLNKFCKALFIQGQISFGLTSLYIYDDKFRRIEEIRNQIDENCINSSYRLEENNYEYSFGHLTSYGASYYSYMWSLVYAVNLFQYIKEHGLDNPVVGERLKEYILSKGGEEEPLILITNFLQKEPSFDTFKDYILGT